MTHKICHRCDLNQPIENYYKEKRHLDGLYSICKDCIAKAWKKNYEKNKHKYILKAKIWRKNNPEKVRASDRKYREKDIKKYRERKRKELSLRRKNSPWKIFNYYVKARCGKHRNYKHIQNNLTEEDIKYLWFRDKGFALRQPSLDRIDSSGNYEIDNCRFIEMRLNSLKGILEGCHKEIIRSFGKGMWFKLLREIYKEGGDINDSNS